MVFIKTDSVETALFDELDLAQVLLVDVVALGRIKQAVRVRVDGWRVEIRLG